MPRIAEHMVFVAVCHCQPGRRPLASCKVEGTRLPPFSISAIRRHILTYDSVSAAAQTLVPLLSVASCHLIQGASLTHLFHPRFPNLG